MKKGLSKGQELAARILTLEQENTKLRSLLGNLRTAVYDLLENDLINLVEEKVRDERDYHVY